MINEQKEDKSAKKVNIERDQKIEKIKIKEKQKIDKKQSFLLKILISMFCNCLTWSKAWISHLNLKYQYKNKVIKYITRIICLETQKAYY